MLCSNHISSRILNSNLPLCFIFHRPCNSTYCLFQTMVTFKLGHFINNTIALYSLHFLLIFFIYSLHFLFIFFIYRNWNMSFQRKQHYFWIYSVSKSRYFPHLFLNLIGLNRLETHWFEVFVYFLTNFVHQSLHTVKTNSFLTLTNFLIVLPFTIHLEISFFPLIFVVLIISEEEFCIV